MHRKGEIKYNTYFLKILYAKSSSFLCMCETEQAFDSIFPDFFKVTCAGAAHQL